MRISCIFISLFGFVSYAFAGESQNFLDQLVKDLKKPANKAQWEQYQYLTSLGWKFAVQDQNVLIKVELGSPFKKSSFAQIQTADDVQTVFVQKNPSGSYQPVIQQIKEEILPKLTKAPVTTQSWRMKYAQAVQTEGKILNEKLLWPDQDEDALGSGWTPEFAKKAPSPEVLQKIYDENDITSASRKAYIKSLCSFWHFQPTARVKKTSQALMSITRKKTYFGVLGGAEYFYASGGI